MRKPEHIIEIFLQPGELYFGDRYTRIRTLLGSCVSIVMWHREALIGGMCHYMLPTRKQHDGEPHQPDGRYADEAIYLLLNEIKESGTKAREYRISLFGGGNMFGRPVRYEIGQQNIEAGLALLAAHRLPCHATHVGGEGHRNLIFDIWSGHIALRHVNPVQTPGRRNEASLS